MTIPWMMNCPHDDSGWCLECVVELGKEVERLRAENAELRNRLVNLEDEKNGYIEYVGNALGQAPDGESLWDAAQRVLSDRDRIRVERDELRAKIDAHEKCCAGGWVPVGERLPEDGYKYLCRVEGKKRPRYIELLSGDWCDTYLDDVAVTHWLDARMPGEE